MFYFFLIFVFLNFFLSGYFFLKLFNSIKYVLCFMLFEWLWIIGFYLLLGNYSLLNRYYDKDVMYELDEKALVRKVVIDFERQIALIKQSLYLRNNYILLWHLGKLYEIQGVYDKSLEYINAAYVINNDDIDLMVNYVLIKAKLSKGFLDNECIQISNKILLKDPKQFEILNLLAIDAYKNGNYNIAADYWNFILNNIRNVNEKFSILIKEKLEEISIINRSING